jgi:crotonobetainyl-CoA:carnitine CoA-transferase CaiB-like acyl-CoA transferase
VVTTLDKQVFLRHVHEQHVILASFAAASCGIDWQALHNRLRNARICAIQGCCSALCVQVCVVQAASA